MLCFIFLHFFIFFFFFFFFNDTATTEIYTSVHTLSLHDALPIRASGTRWTRSTWRASTPASSPASRSWRRSEEHTSELQSRTLISYAVFCLKKKKCKQINYSNSSLLQPKQ